MTEKQELQAVQALADCFYFFKRKIMPDMQNAPQHYIALTQMREMGLNEKKLKGFHHFNTHK